MVRALLLALTCAAAASAASYGDYSGVKIPQYGGGEYDMGRDSPPSQPSDDYHGHSPDAPASPDYKYEEEPRVKTERPAKEPDDTDTWRRPGRKQRELVRSAGSDTNMRNKYGLDDDDEEIPKFRTNRRFAKHRPRLKSEIEERVDEIPAPRRQNKYSRDRTDVSDIDRKDYFHIDREYVPDDKNKEFDDDVKFMGDEITKKKDRRRAKSKPVKRPRGTFDDYDDDIPPDRQVKGESDEPLIPRDEMRLHQPAILRKAPGQQVYPPASEDEDEDKADPLKVIPGRFKLKGYNEYDDYYDMKRASNIKNRLPSLLRRTTEKEVVTKTSASVAERELDAALGAKGARRQRKEVTSIPEQPTPITIVAATIPTFAPQAVSPLVNRHWIDFITSKHAERLRISMDHIFLALILNYFLR
ncbi:unnamed protein product [Arctia plantaginis]|uniref:Uncharacterized protein n=1 Tax=Arctia plantaginis TaxID=874455 RepID=A0A8S1BFZ8_ARCPL|nr:unnamed protein product [Arctia plantaginis]